MQKSETMVKKNVNKNYQLKKTAISLRRRVDAFQPMHCERRGCREELNGLNKHYLDFGEGYVFVLWLCDNCTKRFGIVKALIKLKR